MNPDSKPKGNFFKTQCAITKHATVPQVEKPNLAVGMKETRSRSNNMISRRMIEKNFEQFKEGQLKHNQLISFIKQSLNAKNETEFKPDLQSIISTDLRNQLRMMLDRIENMNDENNKLREDCKVLENELVRQKEMYQGQVEAFETKTRDFKNAAKELHKIDQKNYELKKNKEFLEDIDLKNIQKLTDRMRQEQILNENSQSNKLSQQQQTLQNLISDNQCKKDKMQTELDTYDQSIRETKKKIDNYRTELSSLKQTVEGQDQSKITEDIPEYNDLKKHLKDNFSTKNQAVQE